MKGTKVIITMPEMMEQMDVCDKTIHEMIGRGDLPDFTYGSKCSKKKGWHVAVLERHAIERYEESNRFQNISGIPQVRGKDMAVVSLGSADTAMPEKNGSFYHRDSSKQKLRSKEMSGRMRSSSVKSRVTAGFADVAV